jgi:N4-gp56 family major capsid protein
MSIDQTWLYDAPTGVYKNHAMSSEIRKAAIVETKFMQFCRPEPGYGKHKGESITITRVSNLPIPSSGVIQEAQRIPEDQLTLSTVGITVLEWGRSVPYTSLSEDLGSFSMENIVQRALKDQMMVTLDNAAAAAYKSSSVQIRAYASGVSSTTFTTNGAFGGTAVANLNVYQIEQIRDYMFSTLNIPPYEGDDYIALCSTHAKRGVMSDPAWQQWHTYTDNEAKFNGEIGRLEGVRFIEINNTGALSALAGSSTVAGQAIFFGADSVVTAVALDPELRAKQPEDFGRSKSVAWYGILQFGVVWNTANAGEAKIVYFGSN